MKMIQLSKQGHKRKGKQVALVDDEDFERINKWRWHVNSSGYAVRKDYNNGKKTTLMHRVVLNAPDGMDVDHINHNTLDNQKSNIRICTNNENMRNRKTPKHNTSGYKGVVLDSDRVKWKAVVANRIIGRFDTKEDAARAYNKKAKEQFGEFAKPNFIKA